MGIARGGSQVFLGEAGYEIKLFANSNLNMLSFSLGNGMNGSTNVFLKKFIRFYSFYFM